MAETPAPFELIAAALERNLSIRHVYGEPIQRGDTTVVPIAKVAFGFGAGAGQGRRRRSAVDPSGQAAHDSPDGQGAGGGGGVRMTPVGALEVGPGGARFIHFHPVPPLLGAAAVGLVLGWLMARRR